MKQHSSISTALDDGKQDDLLIGWPKRGSDASGEGERCSANSARAAAASGHNREPPMVRLVAAQFAR